MLQLLDNANSDSLRQFANVRRIRVCPDAPRTIHRLDAPERVAYKLM